MKTLSDRDIAFTLLNSYKLQATALTTLVTESANNALRKEATSALTRVFDHQKQIFDFLSQKGWYPVDMAKQDDITKAQRDVQTIQSNIQMVSM
ncbi:spore coat protein [Caldicellulosiruptoraceae bacterium PP1]